MRGSRRDRRSKSSITSIDLRDQRLISDDEMLSSEHERAKGTQSHRGPDSTSRKHAGPATTAEARQGKRTLNLGTPIERCPWNPLEPLEPLEPMEPDRAFQRRPRPTPEHSLRGEITAAGEAVLADRFFAVMAAGRSEAALHADLRVDRARASLDRGGCRRPRLRWTTALTAAAVDRARSRPRDTAARLSRPRARRDRQVVRTSQQSR